MAPEIQAMSTIRKPFIYKDKNLKWPYILFVNHVTCHFLSMGSQTEMKIFQKLLLKVCMEIDN